MEELRHGTEDVLPGGMLAQQLRRDRPLRVKLGIDPTAPDIHLGHVVVLNKLAQFQSAGHTVVLIIGDYTARVGDPSGRDSRRPVLAPDQIDANATTFQDQAFKVLDRGATEVRFNSEWLDMPAERLFELVGKVTVARLLERDDFSRRMAADEPISALELLYPIMQGYDSVAVGSDVELGGTDQKFNLLFARDVQRAYGVPEQSIVTMPILPGLDGERRMSKSLGNYVGVTDPPEEMFGKLMSVPDAVMPLYYELLLGDEEPGAPPVEAKRGLARRLVARFHGEDAAEGAEQRFDRVHVQREAPEDMPEVRLDEALENGGQAGGKVHMPTLIAGAFGITNSEGRRLLQQGGVKLDGESVGGANLDMPREALEGRVLQVGKRRFARLLG
ncbi:MAG TPA: tyrosine--tRNA ligase [Solirubrobacterales bacterium]|jgi:tyrosyl-tRNA synthetase|nr:tyrosine--tRNA ligase [Solirubrobacterales bacterium]